MALVMLIGGGGLSAWGRSGKQLILRLTPRGLRRFRLETTRSWRISSSTASWKACLRRGGNSGEEGEFSTNDADGVQEGEPVGILVGFQRSLMHQAANGEVSHQESKEFLPNQIRCLAPQDDLGAAQMGFEFVQRGFDFPALVIEGRQLVGGRLAGIENGGDEPVDRFGIGDAVQAIVDDAYLHP